MLDWTPVLLCFSPLLSQLKASAEHKKIDVKEYQLKTGIVLLLVKIG